MYINVQEAQGISQFAVFTTLHTYCTTCAHLFSLAQLKHDCTLTSKGKYHHTLMAFDSHKGIEIILYRSLSSDKHLCTQTH